MSRLFSQRNPGFTLLELMLAVALISMLMVIAIPGYTSYVDRARVGATIADLGAISLDIDKFRLANNGELPDSLADANADWRTDPWGNSYEYLVLGGNGNGGARKDKNLNPINSDYDLYSRGKDGLTVSSLVPKKSHDDVIRATNGQFFGLAVDF